MAKQRVTLNHGGIAELLKGDAADGACKPEAEKALARARASAPVDSGAYRASLHLERVVHPTRAVWRVVADVEHAMLVEANTGNLARSL